MKVKILSGNEAGLIKEMGQVEGENAIATGFGEAAEFSPEPEDAKVAVKKTAVAAKKETDAAKAKGAAKKPSAGAAKKKGKAKR